MWLGRRREGGWNGIDRGREGGGGGGGKIEAGRREGACMGW